MGEGPVWDVREQALYFVDIVGKVVHRLHPASGAVRSFPVGKIIGRELEILGSHGMQAYRYQAMMEMIRNGKLKPELLVGKKISLDEAPAALMAMGGFEGIGIGVVTKF